MSFLQICSKCKNLSEIFCGTIAAHTHMFVQNAKKNKYFKEAKNLKSFYPTNEQMYKWTGPSYLTPKIWSNAVTASQTYSGRRALKTFGPKDVGGDELKYNSSCYNSDQFFLLQQMSISSILNDVLMF